MMRVLVIYQHLPHYRRDIFQRLDNVAGMEVVFLASDQGQGGIAVLQDGDVKNFKPARYWMVGPLLFQPRAVREVIVSRYDLVIALGDPHYISTWLLSAICRVRGIPVAFWTHGWNQYHTGVKSRIKNIFFRLPDHLLLYNERAKTIGEQHGFSRSRMSVIYNSVPDGVGDLPDEFESVRGQVESFSASNAGPFVGAVIRLRDEKRLDLLIEAAAIVRLKFPMYSDLAIVLAGDGPARESLKRLASNHGVPVLFLGAVYGDSSLALIYRSIQLTVVPDKLGLSGVQSLKFSIPVVTHSDLDHQMPEVEAIVEGSTGFLHGRDDAVSLSLALNRGLNATSSSKSALAELCVAEASNKWNADAQLNFIMRAIRTIVG